MYLYLVYIIYTGSLKKTYHIDMYRYYICDFSDIYGFLEKNIDYLRDSLELN